MLPKHNFKPAFYISNQHVQTFVAASEFRYRFLAKRSKPLIDASKTRVLRTSKDVRIQIEVSKPQNSIGKIAILFHGWEGSANSSYIISAGQTLFQLGYDIARVNFRDHGDTYHLNKAPFNSVRLDEIAEIVLQIAQLNPGAAIILMGFSLGGNFVLRLAACEQLKGLPLEHTLAICPAVNPVHSSDTIEKGSWFYQKYFVAKWQRSLNKKYSYFPEIMHSPNDLHGNKLNEINKVFVPMHTDYKEPKEYLSAYIISQEMLNSIHHHCHIIYADDDPIIYSNDFDVLNPTQYVTILPQTHGGHCAFLQDWRLTSWIDASLSELLLN